MSKICKLSTKQSIDSAVIQSGSNSCNLDCSNNRLKSLKNISIRENPFSQHIYPQKLQYEAKCFSATQFNSSNWDFKPFFKQNLSNSQTIQSKQKSKNSNNPFLNALQLCSKRNITKSQKQTTKNLKDEILQQINIQDEQQRITYRSFQRQSVKFRR